MKVSILIPHYRTWRWTAACLWHFQQHGLPVESEIILCNNSPGHPAIRAITETELCKGVKVISGDPEFTSHGNGYDLAAKVATGDYFFTAETDSFPTREGWSEPYLKAAAEGYELIGPEIPQSAGRYVHPAGALMSRRVYDAALRWQHGHASWFFCPGAGVMMQMSDRPYHVVAHATEVLRRVVKGTNLEREIDRWARVGPYQEMRSFDEDTFEDYGQRIGIGNFQPLPNKNLYLKIGYEAGQWLAYFAEAYGHKVLRAPVEIEWMAGHEGRQAAGATVFGAFLHCWCGTVSNLPNDLGADVRAFKLAQQDRWFGELPEKLRTQILQLEAKHP